jgi:hypothetical protein
MGGAKIIKDGREEEGKLEVCSERSSLRTRTHQAFFPNLSDLIIGFLGLIINTGERRFSQAPSRYAQAAAT